MRLTAALIDLAKRNSAPLHTHLDDDGLDNSKEKLDEYVMTLAEEFDVSTDLVVVGSAYEPAQRPSLLKGKRKASPSPCQKFFDEIAERPPSPQPKKPRHTIPKPSPCPRTSLDPKPPKEKKPAAQPHSGWSGRIERSPFPPA